MRFRIEARPVRVIRKRARIRRPVLRRIVDASGCIGLEDDPIGLGERGRHSVGNLGLDLKEFAHLQVALECLCPDHGTVAPVHHARLESQRVVRHEDASGQGIARAPTGGIWRGEGRPALGFDDDDVLEPCDLPDNLLGQPFGDRGRTGGRREVVERVDKKPRQVRRGPLQFGRAAHEAPDGAPDRHKQDCRNHEPKPSRRLLDDDRGGYRWLLATLGEDRHVSALWDRDYDRVVFAGREEVAFKRAPEDGPPQSGRLDRSAGRRTRLARTPPWRSSKPLSDRLGSTGSGRRQRQGTFASARLPRNRGSSGPGQAQAGRPRRPTWPKLNPFLLPSQIRTRRLPHRFFLSLAPKGRLPFARRYPCVDCVNYA